MCAYIHYDCGPAFLSNELVHRRAIACSRTFVYNPRDNGQCERYNGIIWSSVKLVLKLRGLDISQWECVGYFRMLCTRFVLICNSIRSLLSLLL